PPKRRSGSRRRDRRRCRRRSPSPRFHRLPSHPRFRGARGADAPPAWGPDDRGDRESVPRPRGHRRPTHRAGQANPGRGARPLRGSPRGRAGRPTHVGPRGHLPHLQRGVFGNRRGRLDASRALRGRAPPRPHPGRARPERAGGPRSGRADGDPVVALRRPGGRVGSASAAPRSRPRTLGPAAHRPRPRGARARGEAERRAWPVRAPGGDRRLPRAVAHGGGDGLEAHRGPLRGAGPPRPVPGRGAEPRRCRRSPSREGNHRMIAKRPGLFPLALIASAALLALVGTALAQADASKPTKPAATAPPQLLSIEEAQAGVRKSPKDPSSYMVLGSAYRRAGRSREALEAFQKMAALAPNASATHVSLGAAYMDLKRNAEALKEFKLAIKLDPSDGAAHYNLGNYYIQAGRRDDATAAYKRATELKPPMPDAWVSLGLIQAEIGKTDEAIASYKKALAIDSTNVRALCNLGNSQYGMGRIPEATSLYRKALKIDPRNQEAIYNMGVAFADAQIYREAINYWQQVVPIDSTAVIAQSAKSSIQVLQDFLNQQKPGTPQNPNAPPAPAPGNHRPCPAHCEPCGSRP